VGFLASAALVGSVLLPSPKPAEPRGVGAPSSFHTLDRLIGNAVPVTSGEAIGKFFKHGAAQ